MGAGPRRQTRPQGKSLVPAGCRGWPYPTCDGASHRIAAGREGSWVETQARRGGGAGAWRWPGLLGRAVVLVKHVRSVRRVRRSTTPLPPFRSAHGAVRALPPTPCWCP
ncbi:hypothetical protein BDA96_04G071400 [Sorghum bicolor]|uniref:Uncharacterized protein n=1 Tax=Sorghum bicolor TaxID=4558 RepID=A0A921UIA1_SORBI|nr:hypothetical protein BDA96_04G071400 [Sorghum bicolor]